MSEVPNASAPESTPEPAQAGELAWKNLPNQLTLVRLILCVIFFAVLTYCSLMLKLPVDATGEMAYHRVFTGRTLHVHAGLHAEQSHLTLLLNGAFVLFLLAALTDILDGRIARKYGLESDLGRIADPFVDKIMILGSFTLLMPLTVHVMGWMVVVILARELLVSGLRGFAESRGLAFGAVRSGKIKMVLQSACVAASLLYLGHPTDSLFEWAFLILLWSALASTVQSGVVYCVRARALLGPLSRELT
ncbi:MAG: CDP-diacylglycerol--glycerol-3-phosphate 3-phosphatidyltransferase [Planctomycetota bacterium]